MGPPRVWPGQARLGPLSAAVRGRSGSRGAELPVWRPRDAEDRGGRGVERAMEECDAGPAPTARVSSGAAGVYLPQAGA